MTRQILVGVALAMSTIPRPGLAQEAGQWSTWPPRAFLLQSLVEDIEPILKSQDLPTGRFGTPPPPPDPECGRDVDDAHQP